jgi:hypothetical protein
MRGGAGLGGGERGCKGCFAGARNFELQLQGADEMKHVRRVCCGDLRQRDIGESGVGDDVVESGDIAGGDGLVEVERRDERPVERALAAAEAQRRPHRGQPRRRSRAESLFDAHHRRNRKARRDGRVSGAEPRQWEWETAGCKEGVRVGFCMHNRGGGGQERSVNGCL